MTKARENSDYTGLQGDLALKSPVSSPSFTGNVGVGVVPEAWQSTYKMVDVNASASFGGHSSYFTYMGNNWYVDASGNHKYKNTSFATRYYQDSSGKHHFQTAPSGTADAAISWTLSMTIDNAGIVTKPLQPAFFVTKSAQQDFNNGVTTVVTWDTEAFDEGGNLASNTFTAPVDGKYFLQAEVRFDHVDTASSYYLIYIVTSNRTSQVIIDPNFTADLAYMSMQNSGVFDMDAGDTAYVQVRQNNGHDVSHVSHGNYSNFSGYLLG